jgi:ADP-ribose pyrophosphatase YjhB (NUDIX family)
VRHRISVGVLVTEGERILLVRHVLPGKYDFWVAPGGGVEGREDLRDAARREAREECGLEIEPGPLAYIEELVDAKMRICKMWFSARLLSGSLTTAAPEAAAEHIVEAAFLSRAELAGRTVFPPVLYDDYWRERGGGFVTPRYLGVREMAL